MPKQTRNPRQAPAPRTPDPVGALSDQALAAELAVGAAVTLTVAAGAAKVVGALIR